MTTDVDVSYAAARAQKRREALIGRKARQRRRERILVFVTPMLLLVLWEILGRLSLIDIRFFPLPSTILGGLFAMVKSGELIVHMLVSLQRVAIGFLFGAVPAIALGIAMGLSRWVRVVVEPISAALYAIPKTALFPLFLILFGLGESSKYAMVAVGVFFPILINTAAGVLQIPGIYYDVGKNFGANRYQVFRTIALPGAIPFIFAGVRLAAGMALVLIAVAEMLGASSGLGYLLWNAWSTFAIDTMYVALVTISALGVIITFLIQELEARLLPWQTR